MKLVPKEDITHITNVFCDAVKAGYVGDGVCLYDYITMCNPTWVKVPPFPEEPYYRFQKLPKWHIKDSTENFHRYIVYIHRLASEGDIDERGFPELVSSREELLVNMDDLWKLLSPSERDEASKHTHKIVLFFEELRGK